MASMPEREELLRAARQAAEHAYAPFSRFRVGAAVAVVDAAGEEHIVSGCNVENASFSLTLCAERTALASAVTLFGVGRGGNGARVTRLAVACIDAAVDAPVAERMPCGACRQWIAELARDALIDVDGADTSFRSEDLLPMGFQLSHEHR